MTEMTSEERVLCALQRKQPDRVPHFEWLVDRRVREALCPGITDFNEFAVQMGQDAVIADPIFKKERVGTNRWLSEWGYVSQDTNEEHGIEVESPIKTLADFDDALMLQLPKKALHCFRTCENDPGQGLRAGPSLS